MSEDRPTGAEGSSGADQNQDRPYDVLKVQDGVPIKMWTRGVPVEYAAQQQLINISRLPFIHRHIAVMPDVHLGKGATVGSVIPTIGAIIPAAVGVDIGCGMMAVRTSMKAEDLPDDLKGIRNCIERELPVGDADFSTRKVPKENEQRWKQLQSGYDWLCEKHPEADTKKNPLVQLGTMGGGNHFCEICLDGEGRVWIMLHSGSRGIGNRIGTYFIKLAQQDMQKFFIKLPDTDLSYFPEGTEHYKDYVTAVSWAQDYAMENRKAMLMEVLAALRNSNQLPEFSLDGEAVNCHHNYVTMENHFGSNVFVTRKGAVRAREGDMGIIPGSMGTRSYIVRGKGNKDAFDSCSHGAGRKMSRNAAKVQYTLEDHIKATEGVECRKDAGVIDETPLAYKRIEDVMAAQESLVDVIHILKQVLCVKG